MNNSFSISEIKDGQHVTSSYLLKEIQRAETKAGKPYLTLKVMDKTGELVGRIWDNADHWQKECEAGTVVELDAHAQLYKGNIQLKINSVQRVSENDVDLQQFIPSSSFDIDTMMTEFISLVKSVENAHIKKLLLKFFNDTDFVEKFKKSPAAKMMHHAYIGGLLEHTLHVARLADRIAGLYPTVDRSLLMAGAMLHDIGKVEELSFSASLFDYSDEGRLVGHMVIGIEMLQERIRKIKNFPADLGHRIKHLILSHHGRYEFGSPTLPMMQEAFILNFIDDLDAKINYFVRLSSQVQEGEYQWSDYQRNLERFLLLSGPMVQQEKNDAKEQGEGEPEFRQPRLF